MDAAVTAVGAALFLALIIERLIETFLAPFLPENLKILSRFGSMMLGVVGALAFGVDLITPTFEAMGAQVPASIVGTVLTGILCGGGSALVHDLWPGSAASIRSRFGSLSTEGQVSAISMPGAVVEDEDDQGENEPEGHRLGRL